GSRRRLQLGLLLGGGCVGVKCEGRARVLLLERLLDEVHQLDLLLRVGRVLADEQAQRAGLLLSAARAGVPIAAREQDGRETCHSSARSGGLQERTSCQTSCVTHRSPTSP